MVIKLKKPLIEQDSIENITTAYYLSKNKAMVEKLVDSGYGMDKILKITSELTVEDSYKVLCSLVEGLNVAKQ